jgi:bifunctional DNA-binding transcriptional regulator/antitoxin component of YhaV-PrlF toxin-antitoxin module
MQSVTLQVAQRGLITLPKALRQAYGIEAGDTMTLLDLGGVFVLAPRQSEVEVLADQLAAEWKGRGESLETMLQAVREEREKYGR